MKRFQFCLIVGFALILGMCLFVPGSEAQSDAATDSGSDTNETSSSGFLSDLWDTLCDWFTPPKKDKPSPRVDPSPPQSGG